uniref:RING-type domain-containing protein n=1 Tax=Clytia hemisphaerica TaxID=252671 RepID=A0A7M5V696_9CNID
MKFINDVTIYNLHNNKTTEDQKMVHGDESLNLLLFGLAAFIIVLIFVLFMVYRLLGCRLSCWMYGIRIRFKKKRKRKCKRYKKLTNIDPKSMENSLDVGNSVSIDNVDNKLCCLALYWDKDDDETEVILPNSHRVTYGEFQPPTQTTERFIDCCCACIERFPQQPKNDTCPICLDVFTQNTSLVLLNCSHGYHDKCLTDWLKANSVSYVQCPICKRGMHVEGFGEEYSLVSNSYHSGGGGSYGFAMPPHAFRNTISYL